MNFVLSIRQGPARVAQRLPGLSKSTLLATARSFHRPAAQSTAKPVAPRMAAWAATRNAFSRGGGRRLYHQELPGQQRTAAGATKHMTAGLRRHRQAILRHTASPRTMTFVLSIRQGPARVAQRLPGLSKSTLLATSRSFHRPAAQSTAKLVSPRLAAWAATRNAFSRGGGRRLYHQELPGQQRTAAGGSAARKLLIGGAVFGGTLVAINAVFNRETRDDGGMPLYEREYLNSTFMHTGLGIGIIGLTARQMVRTGFVYRLMVTNPWVVGLGGLALSFATMIGARSISPDNYIPKYAMWVAFNATQAAFVAPLLAFVPGPLIARAGLYTAAMMGSLSIVGATAKQEKYLYIGGPLLAGLAVVAASGLAPLIIPATAVRTLALTEGIWLYGGLAVFGGFTLYDVQKVLHHARLAEAGRMQRDPVSESISLELDFLNIFIRMVQILMLNQGRKK